jgi:hypothetical protein
MEPPVIATASAGIFIFSLIRSWLWGRVMAVSTPIAREGPVSAVSGYRPQRA